MADGSNPEKISVENQFEYLMWMKERMFELIKINFFIITAVAAIAPFVVEYTGVAISDLTNSRSMILGVVGWIATLFLLVFLLFMIRPASSVEDAPVDLYESYKPLEPAHTPPMSLHLLSNLKNVTTTITIGSGLLLFMGIFEAWATDLYNFMTFLYIIILISFLSISIILLYTYSPSLPLLLDLYIKR